MAVMKRAPKSKITRAMKSRRAQWMRGATSTEGEWNRPLHPGETVGENRISYRREVIPARKELPRVKRAVKKIPSGDAKAGPPPKKAPSPASPPSTSFVTPPRVFSESEWSHLHPGETASENAQSYARIQAGKPSSFPGKGRGRVSKAVRRKVVGGYTSLPQNKVKMPKQP